MSNYVKAVNFAVKDALTSGDPNKKVRGTEIDDEFNAIQTAIATKLDAASPAMTGTPTAPTASVDINTTQIVNARWVRDFLNAYEPLGTIKAFAGNPVNIPAGWNVCDGTNGTVNLRDRFIVGQATGGTFAQNSTGGHTAGSTTLPLSGNVMTAGSHVHGGATGETALTVAQLPPHTHGETALYGGTGASGYINSAPAAYPMNAGPVSTGSGLGHSHSITVDGTHTHSLTGTTAIVPGFFALMFIQKITLL